MAEELINHNGTNIRLISLDANPDIGKFVDFNGKNLIEALDFFKKNTYKNISIFDMTATCGIKYKGKNDLIFLEDFANKLIGLRLLLTKSRRYDVSILSKLNKLEYLYLEEDLGSNIDFANFPNLKYLYIGQWTKKIKKINTIINIENMEIRGYKSKDLSEFSELKKLREIELTRGTLSSLKGIENIDFLDELRLNYCLKLEDIDSIKGKKIKKLVLYNCKKIKNLTNILQSLEGLEWLSIINGNELSDLTFLENLKQLNVFVFTGTKINADDYSPLKRFGYDVLI